MAEVPGTASGSQMEIAVDNQRTSHARAEEDANNVYRADCGAGMKLRKESELAVVSKRSFGARKLVQVPP
jgi:hypothetical protein